MNFQTDWRALSDRIAGFAAAAQQFLDGNGGMSNPDAYDTRRKHLLPAARAIFRDVQEFRSRHGAALPVTACAALDRFIALDIGLFSDKNLDNSEALLAAAVALGGFRAELQFQLSDRSATVLRATERAFQHLVRQIVVDDSYRSRWRSAFDAGEVECERLGSVHLLQHGIWAFKVAADGGRTDLVFAEPLLDMNTVAGAADALVLTEWKVVRSPGETADKLDQARKQTVLYTAGVLGGLELASYRYLVMVSERSLDLPPDEIRDGIEYRHRCIAVAPESPSVQARRAT